MNRSAANNLAYEQIIKREISIRKTQKIKLKTSLKNKNYRGCIIIPILMFSLFPCQNGF